ncbi:hypothetical protein NQZ68_000727 [Dissostichus eleginoides]|nr:hypothetical protein NQZ68_000727 [Dissostichus eleginoides]
MRETKKGREQRAGLVVEEGGVIGEQCKQVRREMRNWRHNDGGYAGAADKLQTSEALQLQPATIQHSLQHQQNPNEP